LAPTLRSSDKSVSKPTSPAGSGSAGSIGKPTVEDPSANPVEMTRVMHHVGDWDRRFLVWSGQYKTPEDVPNKVDHAAIHKARNWARIRLNLYLLGFGAVGCAIAVYLGKDAWRRGETVEGNNLEWHRKINEQHRKEMQLQMERDLAAHPELKDVR